MKLKMKLAQFRGMLVSGELMKQRPQLAQGISWGLNFALGLIMAAVPLMDGCGPFGIAVASQAGGQLGGVLCSLGAALGYLLAFGFEEGLQFVSAVVLVFTAGYVFQGHRFYHSFWFMPLMAGLFTMMTGLLGVLTSPPAAGTSALFRVLLQTMLAAGGCYFFREALDTRERDTESAERRRIISLTILAACLLMALCGLQIAGVASLGRLLSLLAVLVVAYKGGAAGGSAAGCALGLAMDIVTFNAPFYAMGCAVCGLVAGIFARSGRLLFLLSAILTGAVCVICGSFNGLRAEFLIEELLAAALFLALPNRFLNHIGAALHPLRMADGERGLRHYTARRIRRMGEAFRDLYDTVDGAISADDCGEDISRVFDRASELVCSRCRNKSQCWHSDFLDTLSVFNDATPRIRDRGLLLRDDLPAYFLDKCLNPEALVNAINGELRTQMYRRQFRARMAENRSAAYSQYLEVAEVLNEVSDELQNAFGPDQLASRRLSRYLSSLDLDADLSVFRDRVGRLHIILESTKLSSLLREPGYLDKLSGVVGVRLCRPMGSDAEAEGRITLMEAEPLSVSVGIASLKKKGERVSGDRGTYFKTEQGVLCIILSDGMGSGEGAARESVAAVRILERFLRAGVDPAVSMRMLNSMMLLKNNDTWGFATVDLMCVDLFSGEAAFYKYGAAPSYVRSAGGKNVKRIRSETMAAGLMHGNAQSGETMPDIVKLRMKPGSMALIASDGVIAETNDDWLRTLLADYTSTDTKTLARDALQAALKQYGSGDDMTVLAMRVESRA